MLDNWRTSGYLPDGVNGIDGSTASGEFTKGNMHGSGIGLTISRYLVEAQGGSIGLHSQVGEGTVAVVTLPAVFPG